MKYLLFLITTFSFGKTVCGQDFESALEKYQNEYNPEKLWLHFDKSVYGPGETVWFKAYLLEGIFPGTESKNLYVDWSDEEGKLVYRSVSPIVSGVSANQFEIPGNYTHGALHVKAYTKWMLNFDSSFLFQKNLPIVLPNKKSVVEKKEIIPSLRFFPESGDAVIGLSSKIAFKANNQFGEPITIKGAVYTNKNELVDSLRIQFNGMGYFILHPIAGETYTAKWKDEKGKEYTTPLPAAKAEGMVMQLSAPSDKRRFTITANKEVAGKYKIVGTLKNHVIFQMEKEFVNKTMTGIVPLANLPSGVFTITLLDPNNNPVIERVAFIDNKEYLVPTNFEVKHWGLNKRAKNEIEISVPQGVAGEFSISVTDAAIQNDTSENIISHLLLSSELKGTVYNPSSYFQQSVSRENELDLVMLTNGWRRFNWAEIAKGQLPTINYPKEIDYLTLSGKIIGGVPSQFANAGQILLMIKPKDGMPIVAQTPIEKDGSFNDISTILFDTSTVYYQFPKKDLNELSINFLPNRLPAFKFNTLAKRVFLYDTAGLAYQLRLVEELDKIYQQFKGETLENVVVRSKAKSRLNEMNEKYASGFFSSDNGYSFDLVNDPFAKGAANIFTYLQSKVPGLQISNAMSNEPELSWRGGPPALYLDEMKVDAATIATVPVDNIAFLKVFRPPFYGGMDGANGAIALYSRRGGDVPYEPGKGLASSTVLGYTAVKEFYAPNYDSYNEKNEQRDIRTTLYWNPFVQFTPESNTIKLSFYNNDISNAFRVKIEGMTTEGKLTHLEEIME